MTDAYVHVEAEPGETAGVAGALRDHDAIIDAHVVTGEYDVIARLDLDDPDVETIDWLQREIDDEGRDGAVEAVVEDIGAVEGVAGTTTSMAYEP